MTAYLRSTVLHWATRTGRRTMRGIRVPGITAIRPLPFIRLTNYIMVA